MKKRILFASWYTGLGGGETDLLTLAASLDDRFERRLLLPADGQLGAGWRKAGWQTHIIPYRGATTFFVPRIWARFPVVRHFAGLLHRERIAAVHSDYHTLPLVAAAAQSAQIPVVFTVWGWWFKPKFWQRRFFRAIPATVARSNAIRDGFLGSPPFMPAERLPVVYSGVDTARFSPAADGAALRRALGIADDAMVVAMAARFQPVKGHHVFQAMAEQIARQDPRTQFIVAGDAIFGLASEERYRDQMLAQAQANPLLRERLHYIGFRHDVETVYAAADVVVCASDFESYGKANLEAMACGRPVVSTRRGGPSETIRDGETGLLVDSGDASGLARQVLRLLRDDALRRGIGEAAQQHVRQHFSTEHAAQVYTQLFDSLAP